MKKRFRAAALALSATLMLGALAGCGSSSAADQREIIRIGHNQSTNHPTHLALVAFEEFIESKLGDKYDVEVFPSELLGSQNEMEQLEVYKRQHGACAVHLGRPDQHGARLCVYRRF